MSGTLTPLPYFAGHNSVGQIAAGPAQITRADVGEGRRRRGGVAPVSHAGWPSRMAPPCL
jgi:hypothetical protein